MHLKWARWALGWPMANWPTHMCSWARLPDSPRLWQMKTWQSIDCTGTWIEKKILNDRLNKWMTEWTNSSNGTLLTLTLSQKNSFTFYMFWLWEIHWQQDEKQVCLIRWQNQRQIKRAYRHPTFIFKHKFRNTETSFLELHLWHLREKESCCNKKQSTKFPNEIACSTG